MNNAISKIKELEFEKILWGIFIFLSALNIYGDNIQELFFINKDYMAEKKAKNIFIITIVISLLIYIYFVYRNYNYFKNAQENNHDTNLYLIRLVGSILVVVGVICLLYYQAFENTPIGTPAI